MPLSQIVVPVDYSEKSEGAARYAEAMHGRFGSRVTLWPSIHRIDTEYLDGPFRYLKSHWHFEDAGAGEFDAAGEAGDRGSGWRRAAGVAVHGFGG